ncbi:hypothetical protein C6P46_006372 [Rhodotorula mucilaginosa]|uniref:Uncharacterized protein n=1 Tax=Rhodotorula mucilaginosa TaxID=5537 RepID=A0A9P6W843_RHOMI|nr:hypothetical protein C6P46_006372 [Rhodotorula mucilaginosa]
MPGMTANAAQLITHHAYGKHVDQGDQVEVPMAMHLPLGYPSLLPDEILSMILYPLVGRVDTPYATSEEQRERLLLAAKVARLSRAWRALARSWWSRLEFEIGHPLDPLLLILLQTGALERHAQYVQHLTFTTPVHARATSFRDKAQADAEDAAEMVPLTFRNFCTEVETVTLGSDITTAKYWTWALYAPPLPRLERLSCVLSFSQRRFLHRLEDAPSLRHLDVTVRRSERNIRRWLEEPYNGALPTLELRELRLVSELDKPNTISFAQLVHDLSSMIDPTCLANVDIAYYSEHADVSALLARCRGLRSLALRPAVSSEGARDLSKLVAAQASDWPVLERLELELHPSDLLRHPDRPVSMVPLDLSDLIAHLPATLNQLNVAYVLESSDELFFRSVFSDKAHPHLTSIGAYVLSKPSDKTAEPLPIRKRWQRS